MTVHTPKYRLHKGSGQALVQINGRRIYLGRHGSEESKQRYRQAVAEWLKNGHHPPVSSQFTTCGDCPTIAELIRSYWQFAQTYYVKNGKPTDELKGLRAAFRPIKNLYGRMLIADFGPGELKTVRETFVTAGNSRGYINANIRRIRRMFRWGVENDLVPSHVWQALQAVSGLKRGRSKATEPKPIGPVSAENVERTLPHLTSVVQAMVQFQQLVGCRPGEARIIRPCDVDRSGDVWAYRPESHKTEHYGRRRIIFIGPKAQAVLGPWLDRPADSHCFSPRESREEWIAKQRRNRKTPITPSQASRKRKQNPQRAPGDCFTRHSYHHAVVKACRRADIPPWTPNQLRHSRGTEIRKHFGLEAAQVTLGHSQADVTQVYAERDFELARKIMRDIG